MCQLLSSGFPSPAARWAPNKYTPVRVTGLLSATCRSHGRVPPAFLPAAPSLPLPAPLPAGGTQSQREGSCALPGSPPTDRPTALSDMGEPGSLIHRLYTIGMLTAAASPIMWTLYRTMPEKLLAWSLAHKKSEAVSETLYVLGSPPSQRVRHSLSPVHTGDHMEVDSL